MKKTIFLVMILFSAIMISAFNNQIKYEGINHAVIFKNGISYIERKYKVDYSSGKLIIKNIPNAYFGTFWMESMNQKYKIVEIKSEIMNIQKSRKVENFIEMLEANKGEYIVVQYKQKRVKGKIVFAGSSNSSNEKILLLKSGKQTILLKIDLIDQITWENDVLENYNYIEKSAVMFLKFDKKCRNVPVKMHYFTGGLSWIPSYTVDITNKKRAVVKMRAVIINESESFINSSMDLAVGFPNFKYAGISSPMSFNQNLTQFINAINRNRGMNYSQTANVLTQSVAYDAAASTNRLNNINTESVEDLFFYKLKNVSLKKNQRMQIDIFERSVDYSHFYKWDIPKTSTVNSSGYYRSVNNNVNEKVWHVIRLKNMTDVPWTTAPALAIANGYPISQDILNYTPVNASSIFRLTISPEIKIERFEEEKGRKRNVKLGSFSGNYDYITIEGKLYVKNSKDENVNIVISKTIDGEVIDAQENPQIVKEGGRLNAINSISKIEWNIKLKPGEEKNITYTYKIYVRK